MTSIDASPTPVHTDDDALHAFVDSNPGQGSFEEYRLIRDVIRARAPCALLVFGVGRDSRIWLGENAGGSTVFLEHNADWIEKTHEVLPEADVVQVHYGTRRTQWKRLLERQDKLFMTGLPNRVLSTNWDVIFVDAPPGGSRKRSGRMKSIYTASVLARRSTDVDVLVHDCHREVEATYSERFLGMERLRQQVKTLRHFHLRPTLDR